MTWRDDLADLRRMAAERQRQHGADDELAASFLRIAAQLDAEHRHVREPGEDG